MVCTENEAKGIDQEEARHFIYGTRLNGSTSRGPVSYNRSVRRAAAFLLTAVFSAHAQLPQGAWLDTPPKPQPFKQWNRAGDAIPRAPKIFRDAEEIPRMCRAIPRKPASKEELEVAGRGWMLFGNYHDNSGTVIIGAMANLDGMCRVDLYQDFVFIKGVYAGTLSPKLMNARSDGASITIGFPKPGGISATFNRYTEKDPLCCPSRISEATYEIQQARGKPVVALTGVRTRPAERQTRPTTN
jgi:LppP/LprE lipoprotein